MNDYVSRGTNVTTIDGKEFDYYGHAGGYVVYSNGNKLYCGVEDQMIELAIGPDDVQYINSGTQIPVPNTNINLNPVDLYANDYLPVSLGNTTIPSSVAGGTEKVEENTNSVTQTEKMDPDRVNEMRNNAGKRAPSGNSGGSSTHENVLENGEVAVHGGGGGSFGDPADTTTNNRPSGGHYVDEKQKTFSDRTGSVYEIDDDYKDEMQEEKTENVNYASVKESDTSTSKFIAATFGEATGSGSWDFTVDSELQIAIKDKLNKAADDFDNEVSQLYAAINQKLKEHWQGNDYDAYANGADAYKEALKDLGNSMRMFANHYDKLATSTDNLAEDLSTLLQNCTTRTKE